MAGETVPVVLLPKTTTLSGCIMSGEGFTTVAMDVTPYAGASVTAWRGHVVGTVPVSPADPFELYFEQSNDRQSWIECPGSPVGTPGHPGENNAQSYYLLFFMRWFRVRVKLYDADNVVSCWILGSLEQRRR